MPYQLYGAVHCSGTEHRNIFTEVQCANALVYGHANVWAAISPIGPLFAHFPQNFPRSSERASPKCITSPSGLTTKITTNEEKNILQFILLIPDRGQDPIDRKVKLHDPNWYMPKEAEKSEKKRLILQMKCRNSKVDISIKLSLKNSKSISNNQNSKWKENISNTKSMSNNRK